jgi:hypothetical protein
MSSIVGGCSNLALPLILRRYGETDSLELIVTTLVVGRGLVSVLETGIYVF